MPETLTGPAFRVDASQLKRYGRAFEKSGKGGTGEAGREVEATDCSSRSDIPLPTPLTLVHNLVVLDTSFRPRKQEGWKPEATSIVYGVEAEMAVGKRPIAGVKSRARLCYKETLIHDDYSPNAHRIRMDSLKSQKI